MDILENIIFRKLNKNDKELFIQLRFAYLSEEYNLNEIEKVQLNNNLNLYFEKHIMENDFIGIIGEYNGEIISVAYLAISEKPANPNFINGKTGTLLNVYTYPKYRKNGIATKLIKEIINEAKKLDIKRIDLMATEAGYNLYKNLGFRDSKDKSMNKNI
jgi:GNAT superfamily N-acetyltransferase